MDFVQWPTEATIPLIDKRNRYFGLERSLALLSFAFFISREGLRRLWLLACL